MSLEEEYENQESWRASHDKLTFILCQPVLAAGGGGGENDNGNESVTSGEVDRAERMIGDINFFLYPDDEDDEDEDGQQIQQLQRKKKQLCVGEVDIMVAGENDRGKGLGTAAVTAFLHYIWSNLDAILAEYVSQQQQEAEGGEQQQAGLELKLLMAKIKATNAGSIALFKRLGFEQEGDVNYFGEIKMVLKEFEGIARGVDGYRVVEYRRTVE